MKLDRKVAQKSQRYFVTGVSLITSNGSRGQNVMAAEWTMQISYEPILIAVFIHEGSSTLKNILETKQFGVNVASEEQTVPVSVAGGYTRKEIDKLALRNLFGLFRAKELNVPLIAGCVINAECVLITAKKIGDHVMVVGKVVSIRHDASKRPLVYHQGKYFKVGEPIRLFRQEVKINSDMFDLFSKRANGRFVLKCIGILVKSKGNLLVVRDTKSSLETIPFFEPARGQDSNNALKKYLKKSELVLAVNSRPFLKRLIFKNGRRVQRANFLLFEGRIKKTPSNFKWKPMRRDLLLKSLV